ncbi:MAG TPA: DUF1565 domain-containing protein [Thermoplasmatales archaeon]|nr:DUF1565 domain-containing protein [Thermoplasmatales archaeon]
MNKWIVTFISMLILMSMFFAGCMEKNSFEEKTKCVLIEGKGKYSSIQNAVNHASDGDTVIVQPGVYYEKITINKPITLVGSGADKTVITCKNASEVFTITESTDIIRINADNCTIQGFTITSPSKELSSRTHGIVINSSNNRIVNNTISHCAYGIYTYHKTRGNNISHNIVTDNKYGIYLFFGTENNIILRNNVSYNDYGIRVKSINNTVFENLILRNNVMGVYLCCVAAGNLVYGNAFIGNNENARCDKAVNGVWSHDGMGNYWDDYNGTDEDGDGVGDTPYQIPGGGNCEDEFPLMNFRWVG